MTHVLIAIATFALLALAAGLLLVQPVPPPAARAFAAFVVGVVATLIAGVAMVIAPPSAIASTLLMLIGSLHITIVAGRSVAPRRRR